MAVGEIDLVKLIEALAKILWPLIFVYLLYSFRDAIKSVISSATSRKFTLKVAGNELTMEEVTEQQRHLISDMQSEIGDIQKAIENLLSDDSSMQVMNESHQAGTESVSSILWVDDRPKNNAFLIANIEEMGVSVKTVKSSEEALNIFRPGRYDRIISDMGRPEGDYAGIELVKEIRAIDDNVPFHIFCGGWAAKHLKTEALNAGANSITSSGTTLLKSLDLGLHG
ncbi:response regulator [Pseudoalteromonas shioyasakiensis]|uniref:Response regulator n=1 Tax=Pseudoalteromonas shioyasakiensis TaxID=1190813 RepID=A0ABT6TUP8_9GAMM|nr:MULTISPECIES: response regulator [Pseudoalteromonas]MDI4667631.1 response regulator [Pseudoalteromonas shioyasakiensis]MDI4673139.1 response regulator [Pseudoalteromonas shioyasakiensis]MDI4685203.1 response regulator [Pseudoalteromonas shioyasakiensis]MDI4705070.1 response regulator [Pseudoalteromonas shioyasakiensis]NUJ20540.1 response regulator [Pseudoalteromonas sp. 0802]